MEQGSYRDATCTQLQIQWILGAPFTNLGLRDDCVTLWEDVGMYFSTTSVEKKKSDFCQIRLTYFARQCIIVGFVTSTERSKSQTCSGHCLALDDRRRHVKKLSYRKINLLRICRPITRLVILLGELLGHNISTKKNKTKTENPNFRTSCLSSYVYLFIAWQKISQKVQ